MRIKISILGKAYSIVGLISICFLYISSLVMIFCASVAIELLILGCISLMLWIGLTLYIGFSDPYFLIIDNSVITETTLFGKVKKENNLSDIKSISVVTLTVPRLSFDMYCICFSDDIVVENREDYHEVLANEKVVLLDHSKRYLAIIKKFCACEIIDKRDGRNWFGRRYK